MLIAGGAGLSGPVGTANPALASAEVFDPSSGTFTQADPMPTPHHRHASAMVGAAYVTVLGGFGVGDAPTGDVAHYDWKAGQFLAAGPANARVGATIVPPPAPPGVTPGASYYAGGGTPQPDDTVFGTSATQLCEMGCLAGFPLLAARAFHTATHIPGKLVPGGVDSVLYVGGFPSLSAGPYAEVAPMATVYVTPVPPGAVTARWRHAAAQLPSGDVIVAGGTASSAPPWTPLLVAERFHPSPGGNAFVSAGVLKEGRVFPVAAALSVPGELALFAGGTDASGVALSSAELYRGATKSFVPAPPMSAPRSLAAAVATPNVPGASAPGAVFVFGGFDADGKAQTSAERFDPNGGPNGAFGPIAPAMSRRTGHTNTPTVSGALLVAGGRDESGTPTATTVLLDPATWKSTPGPAMASPRAGHTATPLPDGRVLFAGGESTGGTVLGTAEIFDPQKGATGATFPMLPRRSHTATLLRGGTVLLAGGLDGNGTVLASVEVWNEKTIAPSGASFVSPRAGHGAARLPDGRVLFVGGGAPSTPTLELYDPKNDAMVTAEPIQPGTVLGNVRVGVLGNGDALIAGDSSLCRFAAAATTQHPNGLATCSTFSAKDLISATPMLDGSVLLCGAGSCVAAGAAHVGNALTARVEAGSAGVRAATGAAIFIGTSAAGATRAVSVSRTAASQLVGPRVKSAPPTLAPGVTATLSGEGFFQAPTCTTCGLSAGDPPLGPPVVVFAPDEGPVIACDGLGWTDTTISFVPPVTPFHGRGRLHVIVDGAPSNGAPVFLEGAAKGSACTHDAECASDVCSAGLCCDVRCDGACTTCAASASGAAGTCHPVEAGTDPQGVCAADANTPCRTASCDGAGKCGAKPDDSACPGGLCTAGTCVSKATCDADNRLVSPDGTVVTDCGDYRCASGACPRTCADDRACVDGLRCVNGACSGYCDATSELVVRRGSSSSCVPYRCHEGECLTSCKSGASCAYGFVCATGDDGKGRCAPPAFETGIVDPGCSLARPGAASETTGRAWCLVLGALALAAAAARRPRRRE
jgi:hypothetical protein